MLSSYPIGRILGSEIRVHGLFVMLLVGLVGGSLLRDDTPTALWQGLSYFLLFSMIVLHEFGHALAARLFGIRTPTITLHIMGGIAALERRPQGALAEFVVAFAGPLVNLVIATALFLAGAWQENQAEPLTLAGFLEMLLLINVGLFLFNLLPAFPMDGGRIFKAMLQVVIPERFALLSSVVIGQAFGLCFIVYGLLRLDFMFGVVGIFLFVMAAGEGGRHPLWMFGRAFPAEGRA